MEEIDQEMCLELNQEVLYLAGWRTYKDGEGLVWYCSEDQWSRQFPLFAIMSDNLKEKLQKLFDERWSVSPPARACGNVPLHSEAPPPKDESPPQPPNLPPPLPNIYELPPPPPPPPPPPALAVQPNGGVILNAPEMALVSPSSLMRPTTIAIPNDCSWHTATAWSGHEWPVIHQGYISDENVVNSAGSCDKALQSIRDSLFWNSLRGWKFFHKVVYQRFQAGHLHMNYQNTSGKYLGVELACARCCRYACIQVNTRHDIPDVLEHARARLLSYIAGCEYVVPGSDALRQS